MLIPEIDCAGVDLPAPLSPTRATTSPPRTSKSTPSSACTGPKRLLTPSSASSGATLVLMSVVARSSVPPVPLLDARRRAGALEFALTEVRDLHVAALDDGVDVVL